MKQGCINGHDTGRNKYGNCYACMREASARYVARHPERAAACDRRKYLKIRSTEEGLRIRRERKNKWVKEHPERWKEIQKKARAKRRGVNFWVVAASKSR